MKNRGNNTPAQTFPQMVEAGAEQKRQSKLYKAESAQFVDERLSALVGKTAAELATAAEAKPVSLADTELVKERTILYLKACEASSSFPSVAGLARSMGLSRQALYDCVWRRSPPSTAEWLELCRDSFSDVLSEASLRNAFMACVKPSKLLQKLTNPLAPPPTSGRWRSGLRALW